VPKNVPVLDDFYLLQNKPSPPQAAGYSLEGFYDISAASGGEFNPLGLKGARGWE